jgi:hypothetical protein
MRKIADILRADPRSFFVTPTNALRAIREALEDLRNEIATELETIEGAYEYAQKLRERKFE